MSEAVMFCFKLQSHNIPMLSTLNTSCRGVDLMAFPLGLQIVDLFCTTIIIFSVVHLLVPLEHVYPRQNNTCRVVL